MAEQSQAVLISCPICGQPHQLDPLPPDAVASCVRCGSAIRRRTRNSLHRTAAFSLAALLFYVPANFFPILKLELYGSTTESTVWDGVLLFYRSGQWIMAAVVLLASIVIPMAKLLALFMLVITTQLKMSRGKLFRTWTFRAIDGIGRFAMLDVFVLAIWVALVKLEKLASVSPGGGLLPFGCVVIFTLLASMSFDPQLIWETENFE